MTTGQSKASQRNYFLEMIHAYEKDGHFESKEGSADNDFSSTERLSEASSSGDNTLANDGHRESSNEEKEHVQLEDEEKHEVKEEAKLSISINHEKENNQSKIISEEDRATGEVSLKVYYTYIMKGGGIAMAVAQILLNIIGEGLSIFSSWWISHWAQWQQQRQQNGNGHKDINYGIGNATAYNILQYLPPLSLQLMNEAYYSPFTINSHYSKASGNESSYSSSSSSSSSSISPWHFIAIYSLISLVICILMFLRNIVTRLSGCESTKNLFRNLLSTVLHAPMSFYDTTPLGRVTNRFARDVNVLDDSLPGTIRWYLFGGANLFWSVLYVCLVMPYMTIALLPIACFYRRTER
jgi:hypothetical protein